MPESNRSTLDIIKNKRKREELAELLAERAKWTRVRKEAEDNEKACSETLLPLLDEFSITNIAAPDDFGVTKQFLVVRGVSSHINKIKLIEQGIDPEVIEMATDHKEFTSLQVRSLKTEAA